MPSRLDSFPGALVSFTKEIYGDSPIPLHRPLFGGNEKEYLSACIDSNFVSSVGKLVTEFEQEIARFTGAHYAIATVNGTAALQVALRLANVKENEEVISQALTFVATCNSICYTRAHPVFVDVDRDTLGMSPSALDRFLHKNAEMRNGKAWNRTTNRRLAACLPMHTFGFPCRIEEITAICSEWGIELVEDAAESLGSYIGTKHTGAFGSMAAFSFNGNKLLTTGGGGMITTDNESLAFHAKHLTTTAKLSHDYEYVYDEVGYNYRLPNLNAALGCAQLEQLSRFLDIKAEVARQYASFFSEQGITMVTAREGCVSNNWLNTILLNSRQERDALLAYTNEHGVMTRPAWRLMNKLPMYKGCQHDGLENAQWLEDRIVNLPSSVPDKAI